MPKSQGVPSYRFHRARNCAVVTLDGQDVYLGPFNSPESKAKYAIKIAEWERKQRGAPATTPSPSGTYTCGQLALDYLRFAQSYYVKNGEPTSQVARVREALKALVALYEVHPAVEFGPLKLRNVQQYLISRDLCRSYINSLVGCLKLAFKWAAAEEKLPASVADALRYVTGLKKGRSAAREADPIGPVDTATVNATLKHLSPVVGAMVRLQLLTACRPGEVTAIRPCDVTFSLDGNACYRPESHKTEHHGRDRRIYLGPQAVAILKPFLERDPESYCFSPAESAAWHRNQRQAARKTPRWTSHLRRNSSKRKAQPRRPAGCRYRSASYNQAISRGCMLAFDMPAELRTIDRKLTAEERKALLQQARDWRRRNCWTANQLRHTAGTQLRKKYGIEAAQITLGHSDPNVTEIYAERDFEKAAEIMRSIG